MKWHAGYLAIAAVLCSACSVSSTLPAALSTPAPGFPTSPSLLEIGMARADITPPPGVSTFGHGPDARVSNGFWTRLYCRAFVFKQGNAALAIVPCDLAAVSTVLQRRVAADLAKANIPIPASRLMLTATHTHAGPAHYLNGLAYSGATSSYLPGFDETMTDELAASIADSIRQAYQTSVPAKIRWRHGTSQTLRLTRNRSYDAFLRNNPAAERSCPSADAPPDQCAIDPALDVLEMESSPKDNPAERCFLGSLTFFAMHPTVLPNTNRLLGADVFGVASRVAETQMRGSLSQACKGLQISPSAGIVNTNEGDISPIWASGTVDEAIEIGTRLGQAILAPPGASDTSFRNDVKLAAGYLELDMRNQPVSPGKTCCAELGYAACFGAADHPTLVNAMRSDLFDPIDTTRKDCQAPKRSFPWIFEGPTSGEKNFPSYAPIGMVRIDDTAITFLPFELTMTAGARVNTAVLGAFRKAGHGVDHAVIGGLANGYSEYVATAEEYQLQRYEGASTLFGAQSANLLRQEAEKLATKLAGGVEVLPDFELAHAYPYWAGPHRERKAHEKDGPPTSEIKNRRSIDTCYLPADPGAVCFVWVDAAPGVVPMSTVPWISVQPAQEGSSAFLDDRGSSFLTRVHERDGDGWVWSTLFRPTKQEYATLPRDAQLWIQVGQFRSVRFGQNVMPSPCSARMQRYCGLP